MNDWPSRTEVLVIGGGPGGYAAAFRAADLGHQVTLVSDEVRLGGVCLLRGCIPSKALLDAAELLRLGDRARRRGIDLGEPRVDLERLRSWKNEIVEQLVGGLEGITRRRKIRVVHARARFNSDREVLLENSADDQRNTAGERRMLQFEQAIIATGSTPVSLPNVAFGDRVMSSTGALELRDVPQRLLVVGGGYVGLEMGSVYAALGSRVTLVEMADRLLVNADPDLVEPLEKHLGTLLDDMHLNTTVSEIANTENGVRARFEGDDIADGGHFDRVLIAIGRKPNSTDIGLESVGVDTDEGGFIRVDAQRRTRAGNIFAVGDVAGGRLLAHEAFHEGRTAAEALGGSAAAFDARAVPAVVYTDPQVAWCGLTEQEAESTSIDVRVIRFPWSASGRALSLDGTDGFTKLVTEPESGRILGVGMVGRHAESLIAEGVLAIEMGAVLEDLAYSIAPHPGLSETVHEAAQLGLASPLHLPPRRRNDTTS